MSHWPLHARYNYSLGTPGYQAPESLLYHVYSFKSDVWQLGCILFSLLSSDHAFHPRPPNIKFMTEDPYYYSVGQSVYALLSGEPDPKHLVMPAPRTQGRPGRTLTWALQHGKSSLQVPSCWWRAC